MTRWDEYRKRQSALRTAAQLASCGRLATLEHALAARGLGDVFVGPEDLGREAQQKWWHRLLGRLDGEFGDDLNVPTDRPRLDVVREAWEAQAAAMPGYLLLASRCPDSSTIAADRDRYVGLLALYAGLAEPTDERDTVVAAGRELVAKLEKDSPGRRQRLPRLRRRRPTRVDAKLDLIRSSRFFAECSPDDLVALSRAADLLDAAPGEVLLTNAGPGQWWWFVLDGVVDVVVDERPVTELRAGEWFGPESRLVSNLMPFSLVARSAAEVLVAPRSAFATLLAGSPRLASIVAADRHTTVPSTADEERHVRIYDPAPDVAVGAQPQLSRPRKAG